MGRLAKNGIAPMTREEKYEWRKEHMKQFQIKANKEMEEMKFLMGFESGKARQTYLKKLIREDYERKVK